MGSMLKSHEGKKIICHFGLSTKNKKVSLLDLLLQWDNQSKKDQSHCRFKIMFSHQGKKAYMKKSDIFSHAKITTVVTEHTCGMLHSNMWLNHPSEYSDGYLGVNIEGMKDIMLLLSQKSHDVCNVPCPMMENYILGWRGISAQYVSTTSTNMFYYFFCKPRLPAFVLWPRTRPCLPRKLLHQWMRWLVLMIHSSTMLRKIMQ